MGCVGMSGKEVKSGAWLEAEARIEGNVDVVRDEFLLLWVAEGSGRGMKEDRKPEKK